MNVTNELNLPDVLVRKCTREKHNAEKCISATTLKNGTRAFFLSDRHWDNITVDVSDMLWAMFGTAFHSLMEEESENTFVEELLTWKVGDWTVTGRIDGYDMSTGTIYDWKTTSAWKVIYKDFSDWKFQGLVYAWLLRKNGLPCDECRFIACLKDFSKLKAKTESDYPKKSIYVYQFKVTEKDLAEIEKNINAKIAEIEKSKDLKDDKLPLCSSSERWEKVEYAVYKNETAKRADKLFNAEKFNLPKTELEKMANEYAESVGGIVKDRSTDGKCNGYCQCCEFCDYWQAKYGEGQNGTD